MGLQLVRTGGWISVGPVFGIRGHRASFAGSHTRDSYARGRLALPAVVCQWPPQYFIISRDARYVPLHYTRVFIIRVHAAGLFDFPRVHSRPPSCHATMLCLHILD